MHIRSFLNYIRFEKRYSDHTIKSYENDLNQFMSFVKATFEFDDILKSDSSHIRSFIVNLIDSDKSSASIKRKLSSLRSFYKYMLKKGEIEQSPMASIQAPKQSKSLPSFITENEMNTLISTKVEHSDFETIRNMLIIELLYGTGMRRAELIDLKDSSFDLNKREIKVLGKRRKERIIPFTDSLLSVIEDYLEVRSREVNMLDDNFFVTESGKKMYPKLVYNIVHNALSQISTLKKKSPHVLRHTYATHLLNQGADINAIKELLGHSSLASTQVYTHNTIEKLKEVHKQAHPKS